MAKEDRYAAFIDILGFSNIVAAMQEGDPQEKEIVDALHVIDGLRPPARPLRDGFQIQNFSDSIVMSLPVTMDNLQTLLSACIVLSENFLQQGLFLRGGISRGLLHHDETAIFGRALLDAHVLESTIAKFPRIVLARSVYEDIIEHRKASGKSEAFMISLKQASDGPIFVDILSLTEIANNQMLADEIDDWTTARLEAAKKIHQRVCDNLKIAMHVPRHYEKVVWFVNYWNSRFKKHSTNKRSLPLIDLPE